MREQISMFDVCVDDKVLKPGEYVEESQLGKELTFDEITKLVGTSIAFDCSTESRNWYKIVVVESIYLYENGSRRLIFYDGKKQRGLVGEMYFNKRSIYAARAWSLN